MRKLVTVAVLVVQLVQPAAAQGFRFDGVGLIEMCRRGGCVSAVRDTVAGVQRLGLAEAEFNSQLGAIAAVLFQAASGASQATAVQLAQALDLLVMYSTDVAQRQSFRLVAAQVLDGSSELFDLQTPFAVSPS